MKKGKISSDAGLHRPQKYERNDPFPWVRFEEEKDIPPTITMALSFALAAVGTALIVVAWFG